MDSADKKVTPLSEWGEQKSIPEKKGETNEKISLGNSVESVEKGNFGKGVFSAPIAFLTPELSPRLSRGELKKLCCSI